MRASQCLTYVIGLGWLIASCGRSDDIAEADKKRRAAEEESASLEEENAALVSLLQNVFVTETSVWAPTKAFVDYAAAETSCTDIGYTLPTAVQFAEFKAEVYDLDPEWQKLSVDRFHQQDLTLELENGFAFCRRDRKQGVSDVIF